MSGMNSYRLKQAACRRWPDNSFASRTYHQTK